MAKLALNLSQFKSAGVYTIEVDQSERIVVTSQSLRLVPGFSKQGPFNVPVFIRSTKDRLRFYGENDKKLERKGSFFHRSIDTCLLQTPVFAINLLNVNQSPSDASIDIVDAKALSVDTSIANLGTVSDKYSNFFNKERFWKADTDYLQGVLINKYSSGNAQSAPLFQFANVGTKKLSFIVRKAVGLSGYDVPATEWYGSDTNIPFEWIRPYDQMKDYFVQIIAVEGDWTKYNQLSTDPNFSQYFNANGLIPTETNEFLNLPNVSLVGSWVGTIIPDFRDQTGANKYIEDIVNASTQLSGVLINVNKEALDQLIWDEDDNEWKESSYFVDLVGHNLIDTYDPSGLTSVDKEFLSYDIDVSDNILHDSIGITLSNATGKEFTIDTSGNYTDITVGTLLKKDDNSGEEPQGVTYVTSKTFDGSTYVFETAEPVSGYLSDASTVITQKTIDDASIATHYNFFKLDGLKIKSNHLPGYDEDGAPNLEEGVEKIYGMLEDEGILRGLTNPDMIQYRYIVDTMGNGLKNEMGGKYHLSRLAKKRGKTTAILSAPSITQFATVVDPYFCDIFVPGVDPKPIFSTEWIPQGGNPNMPRTFRFSLPKEDNGSKYIGVFGPFLRYNEGGETFLVPPAADVSNTYVRKFLGGDPYAIVANKNGILANPNIAGVEYLLDQTDRNYLEPFGYNSIIERATTAEVLIYSNQTSYQSVKSDYNYLHVRELLNTIELQVEDVLRNYVFTYNNPVTRLNIVNSVAPILQAIKDSGALYDYELIMDESNNTAEIIDEAFAILDIGVWINKGMEKIINRITVNKLASSGTGGSTTV